MYAVTRYSFRLQVCQTRFWWTRKVKKEIGDLDGSRRDLWMKRLKRYSKNGFRNYQGTDQPIRSEKKKHGVYRIGSEEDLFRVVGFYEDNTDRDFIAIDAFLKKGQKLTIGQQRRVDEVARVRLEGDWEKHYD